MITEQSLFAMSIIPPAPSGNRVIRDDVRRYCDQIGLTGIQVEAAVEVALAAHSVLAGTKTADRLLARMQARDARERVY
jgi:hypothetical protein